MKRGTNSLTSFKGLMKERDKGRRKKVSSQKKSRLRETRDLSSDPNTLAWLVILGATNKGP